MTVKTVRKRRTDRVERDKATSLGYVAGQGESIVREKKAVSSPTDRIGLKQTDGGRAGEQAGGPIVRGCQWLLCGVVAVPWDSLAEAPQLTHRCDMGVSPRGRRMAGWGGVHDVQSNTLDKSSAIFA